MKYLTSVAGAITFTFASPAAAHDWGVTGQVTMIEPTYIPNHIVFKTDVAAGSCPAGALLTWFAQGADVASKVANTQAILAVLLTAKSTGAKVMLFGFNSGCSVQFMHLI